VFFIGAINRPECAKLLTFFSILSTYLSISVSRFILKPDQIIKSTDFLNATSKHRSSYKISSLKFNKYINLKIH